LWVVVFYYVLLILSLKVVFVFCEWLVELIEIDIDMMELVEVVVNYFE